MPSLKAMMGLEKVATAMANLTVSVSQKPYRICHPVNYEKTWKACLRKRKARHLAGCKDFLSRQRTLKIYVSMPMAPFTMLTLFCQLLLTTIILRVR